MSLKRTEAIVIKSINLREADKIITFFSKDYGKIQGVAKGLRKIHSKYSGKLELFTRVNVIFFQKTDHLQAQHPLPRITQVDVVEAFPQLIGDFHKIIGASYIAEILDKVFEGHEDTHNMVYPFVCETFAALAAAGQIRNILPAFEIKLLAYLGYAPLLDACVGCEKSLPEPQNELSAATTMIGFSHSAGGILCQQCKPFRKDALGISLQTIHTLNRFLHTEIAHAASLPMSKASHLEMKSLLAAYMHYHLGMTLKTDLFVQKLRSDKSVAQ